MGTTSTARPIRLSLALALGALGCTGAGALTGPWDGWSVGPGGWRTDPIWYDGQAEVCVYEASRPIYGVPRTYLATAYTNKQQMDPSTSTKAAGSEGVEVFKHHWSERAPTERYDYDFSTAVFVRSEDLAPFKLTAATQEDCGASFKQVWAEGARLSWMDSVYFPDAGIRSGVLARPEQAHFADALPLLLRDFPFDAPQERELWLVPGQRDTHQVSFEPVRAVVRHVGRETLDLPVGSVAAHHLRVDGDGVGCDLWFAADGTAPWLHALVRYGDDRGVTFALKSLQRSAYWERP
jgi:hypothetical protein